MIGSGGDSIGRILIVEFTERDGSAFDEVMQVLNQHSNFEQLQLKNMPMLSLPGLDIYPDRRKVYRNSNEINLTTKEFEIFYLLVINKGRVLTYDQIYHKVWNEDTIGNEKNAVKCHIRNIRDKLDAVMPKAPFVIKCVCEVGYCFEVNAE